MSAPATLQVSLAALPDARAAAAPEAPCTADDTVQLDNARSAERGARAAACSLGAACPRATSSQSPSRTASTRHRSLRGLAPRRRRHPVGALLVRRGKGGRRREVGMDPWGWDELQPWLELRLQMPVGPLFCVINGPTHGLPWSSAAARAYLHKTAVQAGVRRRFAPHQLRHAHAVELAREGVPLIVIQRQLGHSNLGITSVYLQGIDNAEIIETVHARRQPMIPVHTSVPH